MRNLPIQALETFQAVARALSFSAAAKTLHVTQGAVSHRIRGLEESLNVSLFRRSSREVALTPAGLILLETSDAISARLAVGLAAIGELTHAKRLAVSCSPSFAIRWLVPRLGQLRVDLPELEVHIAADERLATPGSAGVDLCIRYGGGAYGRVEASRLTHEQVFAVCSPHYLVQHPLKRPHDLADAVLLHADILAGHPGRVGWEDWLAAADAAHSAPSAGIHFNHAHLALDAAAAGQGVALGRGTLIEDAVNAGQLVRLFDHSIPCGLSYWLITTVGGRTRPAIAEFERWLCGQLTAV